MWRWIFVWLSSWCSVQAVAAAPEALSLAPLFGEHMVLQRDQPLQLWGRGKPGAALSLALAGLKGSTRVDAQGRWRVTLGSLPAGGILRCESVYRTAWTRRLDSGCPATVTFCSPARVSRAKSPIGAFALEEWQA